MLCRYRVIGNGVLVLLEIATFLSSAGGASTSSHLGEIMRWAGPALDWPFEAKRSCDLGVCLGRRLTYTLEVVHTIMLIIIFVVFCPIFHSEACPHMMVSLSTTNHLQSTVMINPAGSLTIHDQLGICHPTYITGSFLHTSWPTYGRAIPIDSNQFYFRPEDF